MSDALKEAMERLERIAKSKDEGSDEPKLEDLLKALENELAGEALAKAKDDKGEGEGEGDGEGKENEHAEPDADNMGGASDGDADNARKSQTDDAFADELVKASEMYADLQKSVEKGIGNVAVDIAGLQKSQADLLKLGIAQANIISTLTKSVQDLMKVAGKQPMAPNSAKLGIGDDGSDGQLKKSATEITEALTKAVRDAKVDPRYLTDWGVYRNVDRLPDEVKKEIGI